MFPYQIENNFSYIRLIHLKILTVKKTLFLLQILSSVPNAILPVLLIVAIGCSNKSKPNDTNIEVEKQFTVDSLLNVSTFLVVSSANQNLYGVIECMKLSNDSLKCFAFNTKEQTFDTLYGYFTTTRAFEITNNSKSVNIRASFNENGLGKGVFSTNSTATYSELRLAPFTVDSTFIGGKDSVFSFVHPQNQIEYQLSFPTFKYPSVMKNVIFSSMMKNSLTFFQQYIDSLNPKEFHFLKYKAICKKVEKDIWNYEWHQETENHKGIPLFELSYFEASASILSTNTLKQVLGTVLKNERNDSVDTFMHQMDSIPFSSTIGLSKMGITVYYPHKTKKNYPFQAKNPRIEKDSLKLNAHTNIRKK